MCPLSSCCCRCQPKRFSIRSKPRKCRALELVVWFPNNFYGLFCSQLWCLEALFDDLHKRTSLLHSHAMSVATLRREHHKLCKVVESADSMLSPLVLEAVAFFIPVICFNFYQGVIAFKRGELTFVFFIVSVLFWFLSATALLGIIMVFGSRVNEKVK